MLEQKTATEESGLATRDEFSNELAPTAAAAKEQYEIQGAMILAQKFPRNEDRAFQSLMRACGRSSFAEDAEYSFPRGGTQIKGPSVNLAREAGRIWGNLRYGFNITNDADGFRQIKGFAYDLETNVKIEAEDGFKKLVFRKNKGWVEPDERDLRELTNRRAAILVRNCILQILPKDLIEDSLNAVHETLRSQAKKDPDGERKKVLTAFSGLNITAQMLEQYLGHPLSQSSPSEIVELRGIYKSISDGNSTWAEYAQTNRKKDKEPKPELITEPQRTALVGLAKESKVTNPQLNEILTRFGCKITAEVTIGQYDAVLDAIKNFHAVDGTPEPESPDTSEATTEGEVEIYDLRTKINNRVAGLGGVEKLSSDSRRDYENLAEMDVPAAKAFLELLG